jgi:hypothetical protein
LRISRRSLVAQIRGGVSFLSVLAGALSLLLALLAFVAIVPAGHVGIPVVLGKVQDRQLNEGLNFVNPFARVVVMSGAHGNVHHVVGDQRGNRQGR